MLVSLHFITKTGHLVTVESNVVPRMGELIAIEGKFYNITAVVWNIPEINSDYYMSNTIRIDIVETKYQPYP
jgi:hypothetical protein